MRGILPIVIVAVSVASLSVGQSTCPPTWLGTLSNPWPGNATAAVMFDDGTGAALHVATAAAGFAGTTPGVAGFRGGVWTTVGTFAAAGGSVSLNALAVFDDGSGTKLYVGGSFTSVSGVPAVALARWDGSTWSAVPGAMFGSPPVVHALAVIDDGTGPALFVGGTFAGVAGIAESNIARYRSTWSALATGTDGTVSCLAGYNNGSGLGIYVGGAFSAAGGGPFLGLCATDPGFLLQQVLSPLGTAPFHFVAASTTSDFGPYPVPPGATFDGVAFDVVPGAVACISPVVRYTVQ